MTKKLDWTRAMADMRRGMSSRAAGVAQGLSPACVRVCAFENKERKREFEEAMRARAEHLGEEIEQIADETPGLAFGHDGNAQVQAAKLRIDTKKWLAAKMLPKIYGERLAVDHSGNVGVAVGVGLLVEDAGVNERLRKVFEVGGGAIVGGAEVVELGSTAEREPVAE